ncbi:hypothetical protein OROGR_022311 [Orobanche gracilis]
MGNGKLRNDEIDDLDVEKALYADAEAQDVTYLGLMFPCAYRFADGAEGNPSVIQQELAKLGSALSKLRIYSRIVTFQKNRGLKTYEKCYVEHEADETLEENSKTMRTLIY